TVGSKKHTYAAKTLSAGLLLPNAKTGAIEYTSGQGLRVLFTAVSPIDQRVAVAGEGATLDGESEDVVVEGDPVASAKQTWAQIIDIYGASPSHEALTPFEDISEIAYGPAKGTLNIVTTSKAGCRTTYQPVGDADGNVKKTSQSC